MAKWNQRTQNRTWRSSKKSLAAAAVAVMLCQPFSYTAAAANITPDGSTKTTVSTAQNGADVVNIAKANSAGISNNLYSNFNVSNKGAVLNNALGTANTQVAGAIAANMNLDKSAALIINQVSSSRTTAINGSLEVGGQRADVIVSNPNGITVNNGHFINMDRAILTTGTPQFKNDDMEQGLAGYSVKKGSIAFNGPLDATQTSRLDILSQAVTVNSAITAKTINVVTGANTISDDLSSVVKDEKAKKAYTSLDASALGAMYGDQIKLIGTADGVGVHNSGIIQAQAGLSMDQAGNIINNGILQGSDVQLASRQSITSESLPDKDGKLPTASISGDKIRMAADKDVSLTASSLTGKDSVTINANQLSINGKTLAADTQETTSAKMSGGITNTRTDKTHREQFVGSQITGGKVDLRAQKKAELNATQINAQDLNLSAGQINLSNTVTTDTTSQLDKNSKFLWYNQTQTDTQEQTIHGNNWQVGQKTNIQASEGTVNAQALSIQSGDLQISGTKGINISGAVAEKNNLTTHSYANETAALKTGSQITGTKDQTFQKSSLRASGNLTLTGGDMNLSGSQVQGKDIVINSQGKVSLDTQATQSAVINDGHFVYWGGIGGGETHANSTTQSVQHGTALQGQTVRVQGQTGIDISAGNIQGQTGIDLTSAAGDIVLRHAMNHTSSLKNDRHGTAFNITDKSHKDQTDADTTLSSSLVSDGNINLNAQKARIVASTLNAGKDITIQADQVTSDIADAQTIKQTQDFNLGFTGYARQDGTALQGIAGARLQGVTHTVGTSTGIATANSMTGKTVTIKGVTGVDLKGSQIQAQTGNANISGKNVTLGAGNVKTGGTFDYTNVSGAGIYAKGGLDRIALGLEAGTEQTNLTTETLKAVVSSVKAGGDIQVQADDTLHNSGTAFSTPGNLQLKAKNILTEAAADRTLDHKVNGKGGIALEAYATTSPSVGAALTLNGKGNGTKTVNSTAVVSDLKGKQIQVTGTDTVTDVGTRYTADGDIRIQAGDYTGKAAENSQIATTHVGNASLGLDVSTSTFQEITAQVAANGAYQYLQTGKGQAVLGQFKGQNLDLKAASNLHSSMNIDVANKATLTAGHDLTLAQADNRQWKTMGGFEAGGSVGATYVPASNAGTPSFSIKAGVNYLDLKDSQAVASTIKAKDITAQAQQIARAEGTHIQADNFTMQAKNTIYDAAYDRHKAFGINTGGNLSLKLSISGEGVSGGGGGAGANFSMVNEKSSQAHSGNIQAKNVTLNADSAEQALTVTGANITADTLNLTNKSGDVALTAAKSDTYKGNWGIGGNAGANASKKGGLSSLSVGGNLDIDTENSQSYQLGRIQANTVNLSAAKDLALQTHLFADKLNGQAGGKLDISSAQNSKKVFQFNIGAHVGGSPVIFNEKTTAADVVKALNSDFQNGTILGMKADGKFNFQVDQQKQTQVSKIEAKDMNFKIGSGQAFVQAAEVKSLSGTGFGGATVTQNAYTDYIHDIGLNLSAKTPNFKQMLNDLINGNPVEKPISVSTHWNWTPDTLVQSQVDVKQ